MAANGALAIWHDVAEGSAAEISDWYNREHHFERLSVPGFLEARRHRLAGGEGREFFSLYLTESPAVLYSAPYLARLGRPTPATQAVMPKYRNMSRTVCRIQWSAGRADGGAVATLAGAGSFDAAVLESIAEEPGMLRCRLLVADESPPPQTNEARLRGGADARVGWAVVIDTNEPHEALAQLERLERTLPPGTEILQRAAYRLVFAARA